MSDWQPIETAPRDGTEVLVYGWWAGEIAGPKTETRVIDIAVWGDKDGDFPGYQWVCTGGDHYACWFKPTHWMPLPAPPEEDK